MLNLADGERLGFEQLVWTAPLALLARALGLPVASAPPRFLPLRLFHFLLDRPAACDCHYLYLNDPAARAFRITLYDNVLERNEAPWRLTVEALDAPGETTAQQAAAVLRELRDAAVLAPGCEARLVLEQSIANGFPEVTLAQDAANRELRERVLEHAPALVLCGRNASDAFFTTDVLLDTAAQLERRFGVPATPETPMSKERVLVIAAHPDDEVLGCGGSIARHVADGDEVQVAIMAQGLFSRGTPEEAEQQALRDACAEANRILGVQGLECFDLPDNRLDSLDLLDLVKPVEALVARHRPGIVYAHWSGDVNIDHRRLHEAVVTACRPQPGHPVHTLLFFEIPSSTEWQVPTARRPSGRAGSTTSARPSTPSCAPSMPTRWRCANGRIRARSRPSSTWPAGAAPAWAWRPPRPSCSAAT